MPRFIIIKICLLLLLLLNITFFSFGQNKLIKPQALQGRNFKCTTFVYNLSLDEMKMKDICFNVSKGEYSNMNEYSREKKRENELWKFQISIEDNNSLSKHNYEASFYVYEDGSEITQYHPFVGNDEFKAVIYNKLRNSWQILLFQNDEYKILSSYSGYYYTNAFGIKTRKKSSISY